MEIVDIYDDYLSRKSAGEVVKFWASAVGHAISSRFDERNFLILNFHANNVDIYRVQKDKSSSSITITGVQINQPHSVFDTIPDNILEKGVSLWWKQVFFDCGSTVQYDRFFDAYRIAEDSDVTFGKLLQMISNSMKDIHPSKVSAIYLSKEIFSITPLRYFFQTKMCSTVRVIPETLCYDDDREYVKQDIGKNKDISLCVNGGISVSQMLGSAPILVHLPINERFLNSYAIKDTITWVSVFGKQDFSYQVGNCKILLVKISAEIDVFSNLFLNFCWNDKRTSLLIK